MRNAHEFIPNNWYPRGDRAATLFCMDDSGDSGSAGDYAYFAFALFALIILWVIDLHP